MKLNVFILTAHHYSASTHSPSATDKTHFSYEWVKWKPVTGISVLKAKSIIFHLNFRVKGYRSMTNTRITLSRLEFPSAPKPTITPKL